MSVRTCLAVLALLCLLACACESSGAGGRKVQITQRDDGCTPASISATPGEKLDLVIKNESGHDPYEVEGIEGAKFEELGVPEGKTRSAGYNVPNSPGVYKLKCYVPGDVSTIIEIVAGDAPAGGGTAGSTPQANETGGAQGSSNPPSTTVAATLVEYGISPDKPSVPAGTIRFIATNTSASMVHELAVLKVKDDGSFENLGETGPLEPGTGGSISVDLQQPGAYQLACLIAKGEAGSNVDHYQQGMHTAFDVTTAP